MNEDVIVITADNAAKAYEAADEIIRLELDYHLEITIKKTRKVKIKKNIAPATPVEIS